MSEEPELTDDELNAILARANAATKGPWKAWIEGRDYSSGDDFIQTGAETNPPDLYVSYLYPEGPEVPAGSNDLDFIAAARQDVPRLVAEVRRLRLERANRTDEEAPDMRLGSVAFRAHAGAEAAWLRGSSRVSNPPPPSPTRVRPSRREGHDDSRRSRASRAVAAATGKARRGGDRSVRHCKT